jgi:hypothetical protein
MTSRKEYHASRDASKVYQSVSVLLFSSMRACNWAIPFNIRTPPVENTYFSWLYTPIVKQPFHGFTRPLWKPASADNVSVVK